MIVKHFKLSQPEKDRLVRIKARTGIQNWNILLKWTGQLLRVSIQKYMKQS